MAHAIPGEKRPVSVDVGEFVRTRDALSTAYMSLSASIDRAVKAYIDHTNVVLAGDAALNISYLTQPFNAITASQVAQLALAQGGNGSAELAPLAEGEDVKGGKKKRNYKPRDPNAPKRPLTAYFRYLQETRPALATEMATARNGQASKPGDLTKEATERWNKMTTEEQQPYKEAYQRALKDYEKEVTAYKISTGEVADEGAASPGAVDELAAPVPVIAAAKEDSETSSDESSDDDEDEEVAMPPPPPPKVASPEAKKTPKSSKKKEKVAPSPIPPTPQFSSINPNVPVVSSSSPEVSKKRKAPAAETESTEEPGKKKRGRKTKAEKAALEEAAAAAAADAKPAVPESDASSTKKEKKKKSRKSES